MFSDLKITTGVGEMAPWLGAFTALAEDPSLVPRTHSEPLIQAQLYLTPFVWFLGAPGSTHTHVSAHIHTVKDRIKY